MNKCLSLVHVITTCFLISPLLSAQHDLPPARIVNLSVDPEQVLVLHVRGYVSSVCVLDEVSSVGPGDLGFFKAEHSEAEPQLVFFKATTAKPAQTNALITTKGGREVSLSLVSEGRTGHSDVVDYVLNFERPHRFVMTSAHSSFAVGDTKNVALDDPPAGIAGGKEQQLLTGERLENPHWEGKVLRVAVGETTEKEQQMSVQFAVLNGSRRTMGSDPLQIQLAGVTKDKYRKAIKAEPVAIKDYRVTMRRLAPGARADGVVILERPSFKESRERLLLAIAQAEGVDRPALVPISFVVPIGGGAP